MRELAAIGFARKNRDNTAIDLCGDEDEEGWTDPLNAKKQKKGTSRQGGGQDIKHQVSVMLETFSKAQVSHEVEKKRRLQLDVDRLQLEKDRLSLDKLIFERGA